MLLRGMVCGGFSSCLLPPALLSLSLALSLLSVPYSCAAFLGISLHKF